MVVLRSFVRHSHTSVDGGIEVMALLTVKQVAEELSVSDNTVRRLIGCRAIAVVQVGKRIRVNQSALDEYVRSHTIGSLSQMAD